MLANSGKTKQKIPPLKPSLAAKGVRFKLSGPNGCSRAAFIESSVGGQIGKIEWSSRDGLATMDIEIWCGLMKLARPGER